MKRTLVLLAALLLLPLAAQAQPATLAEKSAAQSIAPEDLRAPKPPPGRTVPDSGPWSSGRRDVR